jgi:hypothetical protein
VDTCPDCGASLEERPKLELIKGKLDTNTNPRWTAVTNVPNAIIGNFIKGQLEDAGIPVLMFRARSADIAEFSHNDFVPQDLMVPLDRFREARRLIDSAPGNNYGSRLFDVSAEDGEDIALEDEGLAGAEGEPGADAGNVPERWNMLPTEADLQSFQEVRRTHGEALRGWYWSDDRQASARQPDAPYDEEDDPLYNQEYEPEYDDLVQRPAPNPYGTRGYAQTWTRPSKWVKLMYGILLGVMSLPFILQVLHEIWSIMGKLGNPP